MSHPGSCDQYCDAIALPVNQNYFGIFWGHKTLSLPSVYHQRKAAALCALRREQNVPFRIALPMCIRGIEVELISVYGISQ